ncbi:NADP-dependent oxidoreductase [Streptomyces avicenniae]|uniref:NADP-dependent oxidoreductase n=1 Tax=Streptomyces avicenniae TaxID=500153 RepID=UPI00069A3D72|nr:NADP-dependent oxidoreductase [Streptomyces avicenniae]
MRAITQDRLGDPDVLTLTDVPRPEPLPTEVLVRVRAAGVNPVDLSTREGGGMADVIGPPPFTVGWDVAGTVEATGRGVTTLAVGDDVFGMPWFPRRAGAYAAYVTAPSRHFARTPPGTGHAQAAALPLAGLTAWQTLVDTARVGPGQHVLVHAAAGGVGHLAVQIAKARGARVTGTARADKHAFLRGLGADAVVDYTRVAFEQAVRDADVVLDLVGGAEHQRRSLDALRPGGLLIAVPGSLDPAVAEEAAGRGLRATGFLVEPDRAGLDALAALVADGRLRTEVGAVLPLAEAAEAHRRVASRRTTGKIVLTV